MSLRLSRRTLLRGLSGATLALPLLEVMLDGGAAEAATIPSRYLVVFAGQSLGADGDPLHNAYVPNTVGANYDLKTALAPLSDVQSEVSVVSGLKIPTANGGSIPAGGRPDDFHVTSLSPLLSGVRSGTGSDAKGATSDQIVAKAIGGGTAQKSVAFRAQAAWYLSVSAPYGRDVMSYGVDAQGKPYAIPPTVSPRAAFDSLFGNFTPPDAAAAAKQQKAQLSRRSVLDLVAGNTERLMTKLGRSDQLRMQRHLDEVRDLERRVAAIPPAASGICSVPAAPSDPSFGGAQGTNAAGDNTYATNLGYSGEEERARAFCDLIHMAFACDLTRVGTLMLTMFQSHMNMYPLTGHKCDLHEIGHGGDPSPGMNGTVGVSKAMAWHVKHFAYLVRKLRDTPEGNGNLLDHSALVFLNEGGHGADTSSGKTNSAHSTENMACLIAGRAGGLKPGKHVVATGMHPANVLVSAMNAVGVPGGLGEITGNVPGLFT